MRRKRRSPARLVVWKTNVVATTFSAAEVFMFSKVVNSTAGCDPEVTEAAHFSLQSQIRKI